MRSGIDFVIESLTGTNNVAITDRTGIPSAMVRIPKFKISDVIEGGPDKTHPMFIVDGVEKEAIYIGKYEAVVDSGVAHSLAGRMPTNDVSIKQAIQATRAKGEGWHVMTNAEYAGISLLSKANGTLPTGNDYMGQSNRGGSRGILETGQYDDAQTPKVRSENYPGKTVFIPEQTGVYNVDVENAKKLHLRTFSQNTTGWNIEFSVGRVETITECEVPEGAKNLKVVAAPGVWNRTNENVVNLFVGRIMRSFRVFKQEDTFYGFALIVNAKDEVDLGFFTSKDGIKWSDTYTKVYDNIRPDNARLKKLHSIDFDILQHPKTKKWFMYMACNDHLYYSESDKLTEGWGVQREVENKFKTSTSGKAMDNSTSNDPIPATVATGESIVRIGLRPAIHTEGAGAVIHLVFDNNWHRIGEISDSDHSTITGCYTHLITGTKNGENRNSIGGYIETAIPGTSFEFYNADGYLNHILSFDGFWREVDIRNKNNIKIRENHQITGVQKVGDEYFIYTTNVMQKYLVGTTQVDTTSPAVEVLKVGNPLVDETKYTFDTGDVLDIAGSNTARQNDLIDTGFTLVSNTVNHNGKFIRIRMGRRFDEPPSYGRWASKDIEFLVLEESEDLQTWSFVKAYSFGTYSNTWNNYKPKCALRLIAHKNDLYIVFHLTGNGQYISKFPTEGNEMNKPVQITFSGYNNNLIFSLNVADIDNEHHIVTCYGPSGDSTEGEYNVGGMMRQWYYGEFDPESPAVVLKKINTNQTKYFIYSLIAVPKNGKFYVIYTYSKKIKADTACSEGLYMSSGGVMYSHIHYDMMSGIALLDTLDKPMDPSIGSGKLPLPGRAPHHSYSCTRYNGVVFTGGENNEIMISTMASERQALQYRDSNYNTANPYTDLYPICDYFVALDTLKPVNKTGVETTTRRDLSFAPEDKWCFPSAEITITDMVEEPEYAPGDILTFENINRNIIFNYSNITRMRIEAVGGYFIKPGYSGAYTSGELDTNMLSDDERLKISVAEFGCESKHVTPFDGRGSFGGGGGGTGILLGVSDRTKKDLYRFETVSAPMSGAGATSVSIVKTSNISSSDLYNTIEPDKEKMLMIAGGAGGCIQIRGTENTIPPSKANGLVGSDGFSRTNIPMCEGGTQVSGHKMGFGARGDFFSISGGGGGGFWGGKAYKQTSNSIIAADGAAGSSWVSGHPGCVNDLTPNSTVKLTNTVVTGSNNTTSPSYNPATMPWPETFARVTITVLETADSKRDHKSVDEYFPGERFVFNGTKENVHTFQTKNARRLRVECYGPVGARGNDNCGHPGKGGYVSGDLIVTGDTALYPTIGSIGGIGEIGFNGGGAVTGSTKKKPYYGSGSVDVRTRKDDWRSRFIVAGAGGSASFMNDNILVPDSSLVGFEFAFKVSKMIFDGSKIASQFGGAYVDGGVVGLDPLKMDNGKYYIYTRFAFGGLTTEMKKYNVLVYDPLTKLIENRYIDVIGIGKGDQGASSGSVYRNGDNIDFVSISYDNGYSNNRANLYTSTDGINFTKKWEILVDGQRFPGNDFVIFTHNDQHYQALALRKDGKVDYCVSYDNAKTFTTAAKNIIKDSPGAIGNIFVSTSLDYNMLLIFYNVGSQNFYTIASLDMSFIANSVGYDDFVNKRPRGRSNYNMQPFFDPSSPDKVFFFMGYRWDDNLYLGEADMSELTKIDGKSKCAINGNPGGSLVPNGYENPIDYKIPFWKPSEFLSIDTIKEKTGITNFDAYHPVRIRKKNMRYIFMRHTGPGNGVVVSKTTNGTWSAFENVSGITPGISDSIVSSAILIRDTIHLFISHLVDTTKNIWSVFHYTVPDDGKTLTAIGPVQYTDENGAVVDTSVFIHIAFDYEDGKWRALYRSTSGHSYYCESDNGTSFTRKHPIMFDGDDYTVAYHKQKERALVFFSDDAGNGYYIVANKDLTKVSHPVKFADVYRLTPSWNKTDFMARVSCYIDIDESILSVLHNGRYGTNWLEYRASLDTDSSKDDVIDMDFKITHEPNNFFTGFTNPVITTIVDNASMMILEGNGTATIGRHYVINSTTDPQLYENPTGVVYIGYVLDGGKTHAIVANGANTTTFFRHREGYYFKTSSQVECTFDGATRKDLIGINVYLFHDNTYHAIITTKKYKFIHCISNDGKNFTTTKTVLNATPKGNFTVAVDKKRNHLYIVIAPHDDAHIYYYRTNLFDPAVDVSQPVAFNIDPELIKENYKRSAGLYFDGDTATLCIAASGKFYRTAIDLTKKYLVAPLRLFGNEDPIPGKTASYVLGLVSPLKLGPQDYRIYYTAYDPLTPGPNNSIYMAKSDDGIVWHSHKKVIDYKEHMPAEWDAISGKTMTYMTLVNVFVHDGKFHAFLVDNTWDNRDVLLHCVSTDGENWDRATFVSSETVPKLQSVSICRVGTEMAKYYAPKHQSGILQVASAFNMFSSDRNLGAFTDVEFAPGGYVPTWISSAEVTLEPSTGVYHMVLFSFDSKLNSRINVICKAESNDGIHFSKLEKIQSPQEWYSDMDAITHWRELEGRLYVHTSRVTDATDPRHSVFALNAKDITAPVISEFRGEVQHFANVAASNIFDNTQFAPGGGGYIPGRSNHGIGDGGTSYIAGHPKCPDSYDGVVMTNPVVKPGVNDGEGKVIITVLETEETFKYHPGDRIWFNNIDEVATLEPKNATKIRLEAWGANKGDKKGGYAYAIYNVLDSEKQTLYAVAGSSKYNGGSSDFRTLDDPEVNDTINKESRIMYAGYGDGESKSVYTPSTNIVLSNCGTIAGGNTFGYGNGVARASIVETDGKKRSVDSSIAYTGSGPITWSHNGEVTGIYDLVGNLHTLCLGLRINPTTGEPQVIQNNDAARYDMDFESEANWSAVNEHGEPVTKGSGVKYTNLSKTISIQDTAELRALGVVPDGNKWNVYTATGDTPIDVIYRGGAEDNPMSQASMFDVTAKAMDKNVIDRRMGFRICYYEP